VVVFKNQPAGVKNGFFLNVFFCYSFYWTKPRAPPPPPPRSLGPTRERKVSLKNDKKNFLSTNDERGSELIKG
jgi:hypothetical protein